MGGCIHFCVFVYVSFVFAEGFCDEFNFRWQRSTKTPFFVGSSNQILWFYTQDVAHNTTDVFWMLRMLKK